MSVNFSKNQDEITKAWRLVTDSKEAQNWALFGYEGTTNNIKLISTGSTGLKGLVQEFNCSLIQYAFCRIIDKEHGLNKLVLINWQGESSPLSRKGLCASHVGDVVSYFKGCTQTITIRNDDEATPEYLMDQIVKASSSSRISLPRQNSSSTTSGHNDDNSNVGHSTLDRKADVNSELSSVDRKSFWKRQEEEEKERLIEEKKRAAEKQAQFERERKLREESEAKKLAETIKERDRLIEATRQAERRESSGSYQPSSIITANADDDDDERVGRRSELIRLERNQETQSLISKGLIKNKRAIFEQASQQQQNQQHPSGSTTSRRPSGSIITQRVNTFKSMDGDSNVTSSSTSVEKLANGFTKNVNIVDHDNNKPTVQKVVQSVKLVRDDHVQNDAPSTVSSVVTSPELEHRRPESPPKAVVSKDIPCSVENGGKDITTTFNSNRENNNYRINKSPIQETKISSGEVLINGIHMGIRAKALYDYEAADNTEISFDPDDIIGFIEKVDSGWWHGHVVTGKHKGEIGLFPQNYVEELAPEEP